MTLVQLRVLRYLHRVDDRSTPDMDAFTSHSLFTNVVKIILRKSAVDKNFRENESGRGNPGREAASKV